MSLTVYNTLTRRKELFQPLTPPQVTMYVCGVTVYDYCHLGHARTYVVWDVVRRYLTTLGYQVNYVQNFTDVDDKILKRALANHESMTALSQRFMAAYFEDMDRLNILRANAYPQVTTSIPAITTLIESLLLKNFAYTVKSRLDPNLEDVYYDVRQFAPYGQLSGRSLTGMQAGASGRVGDEEGNKRDPFDFALWKSARSEEPGFTSPWGHGRPGWHIECSAMVKTYLGDAIDIHAGGADLIFPHHENELAQSEAVTEKPLAKYWFHNGFLNIDGEKMSKSLGNFTTLRAALETCDPMALRLFFLQTHYRSPIDFTDTAITAAGNGWETLVKAVQALTEPPNLGGDPEPWSQFQTAMNDDFNTPMGLAVAFDLAKDLIRAKNLQSHQQAAEFSPEVLSQKRRTLQQILDTLGFIVPQPKAAAGDQGSLTADHIEDLIAQRRVAKGSRDFAAADQIREQLKSRGITLVDQKDGSTHWFQT